MKKYFLYILLLIGAIGCTERNDILDVNDAPDMTGEPISFASGVRTVSSTTRAGFTDQDQMNAEMGLYRYAKDVYEEFEYLYTFHITMHKQGESTPIESANYQLATADGSTYATDGTLAALAEEGKYPLYWQDNSNKYAFSATAGSESLEQDQSAPELFFRNDRLAGYAFEPLWDEHQGVSFDDIDALNYRTSREWYTANKQLNPSGNDSEWKKIPLYLKHQRAWLTIKLKAGKGVARNLITYEATESGFTSKLLSYDEENAAKEITPWRRAAMIAYDADKNGPAVTLTELENSGETNTITLNAIVEPHNYLEHPELALTEFVLNGSKYTFFPTNDVNYGIWSESKDKTLSGDELTKFQSAERAVQAYNLTSGKHLTITATLTTDHIVLITALLEDWEDVIMSSICDDNGQTGDPIEIKNADDLTAFLTNKNRPGNIGLISTNELTLPDDWQPTELKCMLNLAGAVIHSKGQLFTKMDLNASLLNGTIDITGDAPITSAICDTTKGNIEQINVTLNEEATAYATQGGLVAVNHGSIVDCTTDLPVLGSSGYIGGIAGKSERFIDRENNITLQPIIDHCVVNGRVGALNPTDLSGIGGIAGYAEYRLSRCTFNYGLTLSQQDNENYANIVKATAPDSEAEWVVDAFGNAWPTTKTNTIGKNTSHNANANTNAKYDAAIDCQAELNSLITTANGGRYIIAADFEVGTDWTDWTTSENATKSLSFELDGNDKTITTNGKCLFPQISGYFHDMTIVCNQPLVATSTGNGTDMIAPFAVSVNKRLNNATDLATIEGIKVKMAKMEDNTYTYIQAANPGGIIYEAYNGAKIINCEVKATIKVVFGSDFHDENAHKYAGGIAACATDAYFSGCQVHGGTSIIQDPNEEDETEMDRKFQFRGGIIGGIIAKEGYTPGTTIEDCNSWLECTARMPESKDSPAGAIVGATKYVDSAGIEHQGMKLGEGGNYWKDTSKPVGDLATDNEVIQVLGRRNSVTPTDDSSY